MRLEAHQGDDMMGILLAPFFVKLLTVSAGLGQHKTFNAVGNNKELFDDFVLEL